MRLVNALRLPALADPAAPGLGISDTIELTNYLGQRLSEQKVYLFGNSWGSILGVLAVQRQPELFHADIGAGQMVRPRETDQIIYQQVLDYAARTRRA